MIRTLIAAALLAGALPAAAQTGPATPAALAAIPGVTIKWYDVKGATPEQIRISKKAVRPAAPDNKAERFDVLSTWKIETSWATETLSSGCRIADPEAKFGAEVSLPRLVPADGQSEKLRTDWAAYVEAMAGYEAQFLRYAADHASDVAKAIGASGCTKANDASSKGIAAVASQVAALRAKSKPVKGLF